MTPKKRLHTSAESSGSSTPAIVPQSPLVRLVYVGNDAESLMIPEDQATDDNKQVRQWLLEVHGVSREVEFVRCLESPGVIRVSPKQWYRTGDADAAIPHWARQMQSTITNLNSEVAYLNNFRRRHELVILRDLVKVAIDQLFKYASSNPRQRQTFTQYDASDARASYETAQQRNAATSSSSRPSPNPTGPPLSWANQVVSGLCDNQLRGEIMAGVDKGNLRYMLDLFNSVSSLEVHYFTEQEHEEACVSPLFSDSERAQHSIIFRIVYGRLPRSASGLMV